MNTLAYSAVVRVCLSLLILMAGGQMAVAIPGSSNLDRKGSWPGVLRGDAVDVFVTNHLAYVAIQYGGVAIFDVAQPTNIVRLGGCNTPGIAFGIKVNGSYAYVADYGSGLQVIDISDSGQPELVAACDTEGGWAEDLRLRGGYAYLADGPTGLAVIDISDLAHPRLVWTVDTPGYASDLRVLGDYVYVADWEAGLQVLRISNPMRPTRSGTLNPGGQLTALDAQDLSQPFVISTYATSGITYSARVWSNQVWLADGPAGLTLLESPYVAVPQGPAIVLPPHTRTNAAGSTTSLGVAALGTEPLYFQWRKDGANLVNGGRISGAQASRLTINNFMFADEGEYQVIVTNAYGAVTSPPARLFAVLKIAQASLTPVPLSLDLRVFAETNRAYSLFSKTNLDDPDWVLVEKITNQSGAVLLRDYEVASPQKFYRLSTEGP